MSITVVPAADTDGDGVRDPYDRDGDGDGIPDATEDDNADGDGDPRTNPTDTDNDGLADAYDLDSDNDGIPDNIEAQPTNGYVAPANDDAATYANNNGLNSAYTTGGGYATDGLVPVSTDTDGNPDYRDTDSDDDGDSDTIEAGYVAATSTNDADNDGLLNDYERGTPNDGYVPNDGITNPALAFADSDNDLGVGGDLDYRDAVDDAAGITCGPVSTLYQTVGKDGKAKVFRYNPFLQQYLEVGELEGVNNSSATNSAYNAVTQLVYASAGGNQLRVYDPANNFAFVGTITITGTTRNFTNVLFAQDNLVGFIRDNRIIKFDVSSISSYPATVNVTEINISGPFSTANDYALLGDFIYGVRGNSPARLVKVNVNTGVSVQYDLSFNNITGNTDPAGGGYGAAWQDRFGNFYTFNNTNGDIYKIEDVENTTNGTALTKILLADPSGQNDGFGCELNPDPLDWDGDGVRDDDDIDDDNDGILDTEEDDNTDGDGDPKTNFTDTDGDNVPDAYDLDSDGDGIPDNIEAQATGGYTPPNADDAATYATNNGLNSAYPGGITPIDTDSAFPGADGVPDYRDVDSDNDGTSDLVEANLVLSGQDSDGDGLDNNVDATTGLDDVNGTINNPNVLPNTDGIGDIDVRDAKDSDGDGVQDVNDADDDNDGIPDTLEALGGNQPLGDEDGDGVPNFADTFDNGDAGDGTTTDYTDSDGNGVPDVYDPDGDGVASHLDLDSDNDGIYDAVEASHGQTHTDGEVDGAVGTDGIADAVQDAGNENSGTINYTPADSEATPDGTPDFLETDADGDGCNDVRDAGFTDGDDNGFLGTGTYNAGLTVNADGVVTSGSDGYTAPNADYTDETAKVACNRPPTATDPTLGATEDTPLIITLADLGYSDPDGDELSKITINAIPTSGTLFVDTDGDNLIGTTEALINGSEVGYDDLSNDRLKFLPDTDESGTPYASVNFTVNDGFLDAVAANTLTVNVAAVNDPPTASDQRVTPNEDTDYVFTVADFGYADVDGNGFNHIRITDLPDNGTLFLDDDTDGVVEGTEAVALNQNIAVADIPKLTFKPAPNANGIDYDTFDFLVNDGTDYSATANTITVDVTPVNDIPTTGNQTVTANEDTDYVFVVSDFPYTDPENAPLDHIQITVLPTQGTLFVDANDNQVIDTNEAVAANDDVASGDITRLKFRPAPDANGVGYDSFQFLVNDGEDYSALPASTMTVNVDAANDAPVVTVPADAQSTDEDTDQVFNDANGNRISVADTDGDNQTVTISATNGTFTLSQTTNLTFTAGDGDADATMTFRGSLVDVNAALDGATFAPTAEYNGTAGVTVATDDSNGGSDSEAIAITVNPVNDAPTAANASATTDEDVAYPFVATDFSTSYSDTENDPFNGIRITGLETAGTLTLNGAEVEIGDVVSLDDFTNSALIFIPGADQNGTPYATFTFQVADNATPNAFSTDYTMTVNVLEAGDAPVSANQRVRTDEDQPYAFQDGDFAFTDAADGNAFAGVIIARLPDQGVVSYNGTPVTASDVTDETVFADRSQLRYAPEENDNGDDYTSFDFRVVDDAGDQSQLHTITVDVTSVNDAPEANNGGTVTIAANEEQEDVPLNLAAPSDVDHDDATLLVTVTTLPTLGTVTLANGTSVSVNQVLTIAQLTGLQYDAPDEYNTPDDADEFVYTISDNDATDPKAVSQTVDFTLTPVNDAPTADNERVPAVEDTDYAFKATDFSVNYADAEGDAFAGIKITKLTTAGTLTLNGADVKIGDVVSLNDFTNQTLIFTPAANQNGNDYATFDFQVADATGNYSADYTLTVDMQPDGDAPISADRDITTDEEEAYEFKTEDFAFSDVADGDSFAAVIITSLPDAGTLSYNGTPVTVSDVTSGTAFSDRTQFKYAPEADGFGDPYTSFEFRVRDNAGDVSAPHLVTVEVINVNDAPQANNGGEVTITANEEQEDVPLNLAAPSDVDNDDATLIITITKLPVLGQVTLDGTAVSLNQVLKTDELTRLAYDAPTDYNAPDDAGEFLYTVSDGDQPKTVTQTVSFDLSPVNDAPVANVPASQSTDEDTSLEFRAATNNAISVDDADGDDQTVTITATNGTFTLSQTTGLTFTAGDGDDDATMTFRGSLADVNAALEGAIFTPTDDYDGAEARVVLSTNDGALDSGDETIDITVNPVNDIPVVTDVPKDPVDEDQIVTFVATDFTDQFDDVDGQALAKIQITRLPTHGILRLDGVAVDVDDEILAGQLDQLTVEPTLNFTGTDGFGWNGSDGTAYADVNDPAEVLLTFNPVNDAPVTNNGGDVTISTSEEATNVPLNLAAPSDVDDDDEDLVITITTLPLLGTVTLADGSLVTENQTLTVDQLIGLRYNAPADYNGTDDTGDFEYTVSDGSETIMQRVDFVLSPVPDAPVVSVPAASTTNEDTELTFGTATGNAIRVDDADGDNQTVTITATNGIFTLAQTTGITFAPGSSNGTAIMTFSGSLANVNAALEDVYFTPTENYNGSEAKVEVSTNDGNGGSDTKAIDITVNSDNDAPTAANKTLEVTEDTSRVVAINDLGYADVEGNPLDKITINTAPVAGILFVDSNGNGKVDGSEVVLVDNDEVLFDDLNQGRLTFRPAPDENGDDYARFVFTVNDGTDDAEDTNEITFDVAAVNDAPVANNGGDVDIDADEEDEDVALNLAAPTDVDDNNNALTITVTDLPAPGLGTVTLADGTSLTVGQVLTLTELTNLQYDAPTNYDGASGPGVFAYSVSDDDNASVTQTVNFNLTAVNDGPALAADPSVSTDEDQAYAFTLTDFSTGYQDEEGNAFNGVRITGLETTGTLTLNDVDVEIDDVVSLSDLTNGTLVFTPAANESGDDYATFTFQVADNATSNAYSTDYTMTVNVDPVGDAPVSADRTIETDEDQAYSFVNSDFAFTDDADGDNFAAVIVVGLPDNGTLEYDGNPVTESDVNDATAFADRSLFVFTPVPNEFGVPYATFDFRVTDDKSDTSQVHTVRMDVEAVNDAPEVAEVTKNNGTEDTPLPFTADDFTGAFSDVDGDLLTKIQIKTLPANGTLQLNGADVIVDAEVDAADLDQLVFVPDENFNGDASFEWNGSDGTAYADDNALVNITLAATDDAPEVNEITKLGTEDVPVDFAADNFTDQFNDADGNLLTTVKITSLPSDATLLLNADTVRVNDEIAVTDLGQLTLVPTLDFNGPTVFSWNGSDGTRYAADSALVTVTLAATPDAPTVSEVTKDGQEDEDVAFAATDFTDQFNDADGDALVKVKIVSLPPTTEGTLQLNGVDVAAGDEIDATLLDQLTFVPAPDFNGEVSFAWNGFDGTSYAADDATVNITLEEANDAPQVTDINRPDETEDQPLTFTKDDFTGKFNDADGDTLVSVQITELPTNGTLLLNGDPVAVNDEISVADLANLTLVPNADYVGPVSFTWSGSDGTTYANPTAEVIATFGPAQDAPTLTDVIKDPVDEEQPVTFVATDFTDQFTDADGEGLANVQITYLPTNGTLFLNGTAVNQGDEISAAELDQLTVVPNEHFNGIDSLGWNATDGTDYAAEAARVLLTFLPVQDAPTVSDVTKDAAAGFATPFTADEFSSQFEDVDDEVLVKMQVTSLPTNGTLYLDGVAVSLNDEIAATDLEKLTYVPADGDTGLDSFAWNGSDGTDYAADGAQVLINVLPQEPPVLSDVPKTSDEDETITFAPDDFISQFDDPENDPLTKIKITRLPTQGVLLLDGVPVELDDEIATIDLSKLALVPPANFHGTVSFGWNAYDGFQYAADEAVVTMTINPVPDQPELSEVTKAGEEDQTLLFTATDFTDQFTDGDDDLLTKIQIVSLPENGTLLLNGVPMSAGDEITVAQLEQLTFEPAEHFAGTVTFTWNGYDGTAYAAEPATVTMTIGEQNDGMPVADGATFQTDENTTLTGSLTDFISDPEGRGLVYETTPVTPPAHGTLTINPDGTFTYVPNAGYRGKDTFTYRVCDQGNPEECTTGVVKLIVGEPDDDEDGIPDAVEKGDDPNNPIDTDGDGVPDYQDDDSDNDGIPDGQETGDDPNNPIDTDGDGVPDYRDTDSDDDGLTDTQEAGDDPNNPTDTDGDGTPDFRETDSDNDGLTDTQEAGDNPTQPTDTNGDGVPDYQSTDSDGDGLTDTQEVGPDPQNPRDTDQDGIPNYQETDSDDDGVPDSQEDVITIFEGFSPNSDGKNDTWYIDGIEDYPNNTVQIFNRWGNKIFEMKGYNNDDRAWSSESSLGLILGDTEVPDGTYFYIIDLQDGKKPRSGYLIVNRR